jgi:putative transposase
MQTPPGIAKGNFSGRGTNRAFFLPRLAPAFYQGDAVVHWTMPIAMRGQGWLNEIFHARFRELMLHVAAREKLLCPVYCLMPDHIHLVWMGLHSESDHRAGMKFLREHLAPALRPHRFQHQAHDHVLRDEERKQDAFARVCFYILANPVRACLIKKTEVWPFCGAIFPGYPVLHPREEGFWPLFWKLYGEAHSAEAGQRKLPVGPGKS